MKFKKRAALELSVNAIVVVVIAFVVLGLALTLTRTIFKGAQDKIPEALDITALEAQPTAENPITISNTINLKANGKLEQVVGFYNKGPNTVNAGKFVITSCESEDPKNAKVILTGATANIPTVTTRTEKVDVGAIKPYKTIIKENGLTPGYTYICDFTLIDTKSAPTPNKEIESKSIFLHIVS